MEQTHDNHTNFSTSDQTPETVTPHPVTNHTAPIAHPAHSATATPFMSNSVIIKIEQILMLCYLAVAAMLLFRFVLALFGANPQVGFVSLIYQISTPLMIPFLGMFGRSPGFGQARVEFEVVIALVVYALVFFGLTKLIRILFR